MELFWLNMDNCASILFFEKFHKVFLGNFWKSQKSSLFLCYSIVMLPFVKEKDCQLIGDQLCISVAPATS